MIPLNADGLFVSLSGANNALFEAFAGRLDAQGRGRAKLNLPDIPQLVGITLRAGWITVRPGAPNRIGTISLPVEIEIVP